VAVIPPGQASQFASGSDKLARARQWVRSARQQQMGVFGAQGRRGLEPFEVRFLARRRPPDRWVIDLSKSNNILLRPENYYTVPNCEDRLYIPEEYVSLFVERGWQRQP
jgi:hypothetical protein